MSRSLFRRLNRRFGARTSGAERAARAQAHRARLARFLPLDLLTHALPTVPGTPPRVAVVGAGFAGLAAATLLQNCHFAVTSFEASGRAGGRVRSTTTFVQNRILEEGAELIGANHPWWLELARHFGLGLSVITEDDEYVGALLEQPVRFFGRRLTQAELERLFQAMKHAMDDLTTRAAVVTDPYNPWMTPNAGRLDTTTLDSWIQGVTHDPLVRAALRFDFGNNNAVDTQVQSLLAILTQIAGGGGAAYWEDTEVYRCEDGNAALSLALSSGLRAGQPPASVFFSEAVQEINFVGNEVEIVSAGAGGATRTTRHDYAILAVPPTVWSSIHLGGRPIPLPRIQTGPAVKYLAETRRRYWIQHGDAPSGTDDAMGMLWEGTDNQMIGSGIDLTVFAGGPWATAAGNAGAPFIDPRIESLLPGYSTHSVRSTFVNWPDVPFIRTGYCCPAPGQVVTMMVWLQQAINGRLFFAGEHASPPFFGYMEGALQSGVAAASRVAAAAGVSVPASMGSLSASGVRVQIPPQPPHP